MNRDAAVSDLADRIEVLRFGHPVRVGIDGVDASGKTSLAAELASVLEKRGRKVISVSMDGFHNPRSVRYRQGRFSPRGYYEDSFDPDAVIACVLEPLGPGGSLHYRRAVFDYHTDTPVDSPWATAASEDILLFEGIFVHRPELRGFWDFSIFVRAGFEAILKRAEARDVKLFGSAEKTRELYMRKYIPGQKIYLESERPDERASVIFDNNDLENPTLHP